MSAIAASHVITAFVLVHSDGTFWAIYGSCLLFPLSKLYILLTLPTLVAWVGLHSTWEANASHAVITDYILDWLLWVLPHVALTCGLGAPPQIWVKIDHRISMEAHVLVEQVLFNTIPHFILTKLLQATVLHAANIHDFAFVYLTLQILLVAQLAELMLAPQTIEVLLLDIFVAHITVFDHDSFDAYDFSHGTILIIFGFPDRERLSGRVRTECLLSPHSV